jgi:hypothetical protein
MRVPSVVARWLTPPRAGGAARRTEEMLRAGLTVAVCLGLASLALASCPNQCSGHGRCGANDKCTCFTQSGTYWNQRPQYTGADCSKRELLLPLRCCCANGSLARARTGGRRVPPGDDVRRHRDEH